jgi:hypothetical protein
MDYALSDTDINKILEPDTTVQPYRVLDTLQHIDQVFDQLKRAVLLYNTTDRQTGHWVGLIKRGKKTIEFFDPYGFKPDTQQYRLGKGIDNVAFEQHDHDLTRLLEESGYRVFYNTYPFHDFSDSTIATCGRWVAMRLLHYKKTLRKFFDLIPKGINKDEWVTEQTNRLL